MKLKHNRTYINNLKLTNRLLWCGIALCLIVIGGSYYENHKYLSPCPESGCFVKVVYATNESTELEQITAYIVKKFQPYGRSVATRALACFISESGLRPDAYNFNSNGTEDRGIAQVNSIWKMKPEDANNWKKNIDQALVIFLRANKTFGPWYGRGCH